MRSLVPLGILFLLATGVVVVALVALREKGRAPAPPPAEPPRATPNPDPILDPNPTPILNPNQAPNQAPDPDPDPAPTPPPEAGLRARTGSAACARCHPDVTARWSRTGHALTVREFSDDALKKPFDGEIFPARGIDHRLGPGPWMTGEAPGGGRGRFPVERVVGVRRIQMYLTRVEGRIQVLPVFLEVPANRWFDYTDFIFGGPSDLEVPPDSAYSWYGPHRNFSSRCGRCHMTGFSIGYDADTGRYDSTWSEPTVGCDACHGPSAAHVAKWQKLAPGPDPILNPVSLPVARANEICGFCHSESTMVKPGYRPGDDLYEFVEVTALDDAKHLFPDGRARELIHNLVPILESRCAPLRCTRCHDPHGRGIPGDLYRPLPDDGLCLQCHGDIGVKLTKHTHHKAESAGSRCIACHMPRLVIEGGHGRVYDHTISTPSIENTRRSGLPNACRSCHLTEEPGWEYEPFTRWYPGAEKANHRVALAAAIRAARQRRPEAKERLLPLLEEKSPVYRAGAAFFLARYGTDLRPLLEDPHPLVRRAAIYGVARTHPDALVPLLDDGNAVLRRGAAMALASKRVKKPFDWIAARPELRDRVTGVLEEYARLRPDDADLHGTLEQLYGLAGRAADAQAAGRRYRLLRPWQAK